MFASIVVGILGICARLGLNQSWGGKRFVIWVKQEFLLKHGALFKAFNIKAPLQIQILDHPWAPLLCSHHTTWAPETWCPVARLALHTTVAVLSWFASHCILQTIAAVDATAVTAATVLGPALPPRVRCSSWATGVDGVFPARPTVYCVQPDQLQWVLWCGAYWLDY